MYSIFKRNPFVNDFVRSWDKAKLYPTFYRIYTIQDNFLNLYLTRTLEWCMSIKDFKEFWLGHNLPPFVFKILFSKKLKTWNDLSYLEINTFFTYM